MKKILTVSLFAMMAVSAANADIASTDYVGKQITATAGTLGNLATSDKANLVAAINEVKADVGTVSGNAGNLKTELQQSISDLSDTVSDMDTAYKAADTALDGRVDTLEADNNTNKSNITNLQTAVNNLNDGENSVSSKIATALEAYSTTAQMNTAITNNAVNTVGSGTANGTIAVDGEDVAVKGLGSAAYTESSAYDAAGSAADAEAAAIAAAKTETTTQVNALANGAVKTNTDKIAEINDSAVMKSGVDANVVAKANSAMQVANLKTLESWTAQGCGGENATCSLVSKKGDIAWEKVSY